jgi:hypothetical protein
MWRLFLFIIFSSIALESKAASAFTRVGKNIDLPVAFASLTLRPSLLSLAVACPISMELEIIPSLTFRHIKKGEGILGTYTLSNVRNHHDLLKQVKAILTKEEILAVTYGGLGEYVGPETFTAYLSNMLINAPRSPLIYIYTTS